MRKLTKRSWIVLGVLVLSWAGWRLVGKETETRTLDPNLTWQISKGVDRYVAVAKSGKRGVRATSVNGADWDVERLIVGFNAVAYGAGKFVAVGEQGALGVTTNGVTWQISSITTNDLWAVGFVEGCFVATGRAPLREVLTSQNCRVWRTHEIDESGTLAKFLETWVTVTNRAAEIGSLAGEELSALCRARTFELKGKKTER